MSARPLKKATKEAIILPFLTAGTVRQGMPVKMSGTSVVEATAITDNVIGIAYEQQTNVPQGAAIAGQGWSAPNGAKISVWLLGYGVCPVRVGTCGATV